MKKILLVLMSACLILSAAACSDTATPSDGAAETKAAESVKEYKVGETWTVDDQWELTVTGIKETSDRNEYEDREPAAVYVVDYKYKNIGYTDESGIMNGLFFNLDESIIDVDGQMGYSYPGDITEYAQETPVGASCKAQVCIGVDNAGLPIKINVTQYDGNGVEQTATFTVK